MRTISHDTIRIAAIAAASIAALIMLAPLAASAQGGLARRADTAAVYQVPDLSGTWVRTARSATVENEGEPCLNHVDSRRLPRRGCRFPIDQLDLSERAYAWLEFHDERIEGKYFCVAESIPGLFIRAPVHIDQRVGSVTMQYQHSVHNNVRRVVWTDGRTHPDPSNIPPEYYGHSIGRYEGGEFVVDTRGFTFDPNGIDYVAQIPSSWRKRIVERYSLIAPDRMRMVLTLEDPEFLKTPYTETFEYTRSDYEIQWTHCDVEDASFPLMMLPSKYDK